MYGCVLNAYARVLGALGRGRAHMAVSFGYIRDSIRCAQWRTRRACSPRSVRPKIQQPRQLSLRNAVTPVA